MRIFLRLGIAVGAVASIAASPVWAQTEAGKDLYLSKCSMCHGADGAGKTARGKKLKMQDVRETVKKYSAEDMIKVVNEGKGPNMSGYGKELTKDQVKAVVDYYRSLAK